MLYCKGPVVYFTISVCRGRRCLLSHIILSWLTIHFFHRTIDEAANDGEWHHICATWENSAGSWNFYIDGELKDSGTDFQTGHVINSGGIVILGQDQDDYGDAFDQDQSFFGEMYAVNLWSSVLSAEKILSMSGSCFHERGDYLKWSDFKEAQLHGDVSITSPTTCSL